MSFSNLPDRPFPAQETDTIPIRPTQVIKFAAEALTVLAIGSYAIGFIIVNSYLLAFGFSSSSLFKTTYIGAGILFLLFVTPMALTLYSFILGREWAKDTSQDSSAKRRRLNFVSIPILVFAVYFLLNHIASDELRSTTEEYPFWTICLFAAVLVISMCMLFLENINRGWTLAVWAKKYTGLSSFVLYIAIFLWSYKVQAVYCIVLVALAVWSTIQFFFAERSILVRFRDWPPGVVWDLAIVIGLSLTAIGFFGTTLYGHIRPQYGGGQPSRVRVLIAEDKKTVLSAQSGVRNMDSLLADTQLIDSTEKELLLLLKSTHDDKGVLLQVDRSIVDAVLYLPSSP